MVFAGVSSEDLLRKALLRPNHDLENSGCRWTVECVIRWLLGIKSGNKVVLTRNWVSPENNMRLEVSLAGPGCG